MHLSPQTANERELAWLMFSHLDQTKLGQQINISLIV